MKRAIVICFVAALLLIMTACSPKIADENQQNDNNGKTPGLVEQEDENTTNQPGAVEANTLGGLKLGDTRDRVVEVLGTDYTETAEEDTGFLGEPYTKWVYATGTMVVIGKNTNKLFHIETSDATLPTGIGVKVGDSFGAVSKAYSGYKNMVSDVTGDTMAGWYMVDNNQVVMFDFNADDNAIVNTKDLLEEDSVKIIRMTYRDLID